ncbi:MAG: Eco57I restriction-modification methylase domain-containing protein, partial [Bacteroidales bacterium]|nr:Eco57I restriction-modification methylase domain-containing protein [Bacteroidales bacterium]
LFELTKTQQKVFNKKSAKLAADINKLETELEEIRSNKIYENAFEWRFEFPEVLNNDGDFVGFDVVIGNPPYGVKAVNQEKDYFKKNFKSIVGKFDSYGFFIEKGLKILQQNGQFGYIIPHTWLTVLEAQSLRDFLLEETVIKEVNLLPSRVFEDATVETTNLFLQKRKSNSNSEIKIVTYPTNTKVSKGDEYLKIFFVPIQVWISNRIFNLKISKNENLIIGKMKEDSVMLQDITELSVGIQAYDSYAGQSNDTIKNKVYHSNVQKDETFVKELNGKDILRYSYNWPGDAWVSYGKWLAHPRQKKFFNTERILIREITSNGKYKIVACLIEEYLVNYKSVLNIISKNNEISIDLATILGIINSSLFSWYFEITSNKIVTNTFPRISIYDLKTFPIKLANQICHEQIKAIVIKIQTIKSQDPSADTSALEAEIDLLVYKLYGLTWEEVRIVDPEFGMSEEAYEQFTIAEESKTNN